MDDLTAAAFRARLLPLASAEQKAKYVRFFPGDDSFVGVPMRDVFGLAKAHLAMPADEIEVLLDDEVREARVGACSIMGKAATHKRVSEERHRELYDLYLRRHDRIDTWDLVDLGASQVVGSWLVDRPRDPLYTLARSEAWPERRTAVVATAAFIKRGQVEDTFAISRLLLGDDVELVHKGAGWMLRYAGDVDRAGLTAFLDEHAATMPRAMLRAAIEKLDKPDRATYLASGRS
ncbi:DNA alkylation repair protein [Mumia zhuanghuii]|uniref:DNA alkylation repair protein n=2 Tax=Mumia TaxID=1546255 RepID=A0ABW1QPZ1_9ACTN|nr:MULTISPECIES: DNA alkylation repair protein [Mumia]KAA1423861.1 DNA alkylation repair protein [Mumia zhuanghuii]